MMMKKPDEQKIEDLLQAIQPKPSERFYERLKDAPWQKQESKIIRFPLKKVAAIAALVFALLLLFQPSQVIAQLMQWFFDVQPSEGHISLIVPQATATYLVVTNQPVSTINPQGLHIPAYVPEGYIVEDIHVNRSKGIADIYYTLAGENPLGRSLALFQSKDSSHELQIGENADVQNLLINGVDAQYVQGNWETVNSTILGNELTIQYRWDNRVQMHHLSWEKDGIYYRLFWQAAGIPLTAYYGDGAPNEAGYIPFDDFIHIAESID